MNLFHLFGISERFEKDGWRYSLLVAIPAAVLAYLVALLLERPSGQFSAFDLYTYTGLAFTFLVLEALLLTRKLSLHATLYTILSLISGQFLGKLVFLLFFNPNPENFHAELTETFFWIPAVYILGSFVPGLRWGRPLALTFFAGASLVGGGYILFNAPRGENLGVIYALYELGLANITLLILLQAFLAFKDRLVKQSSRAEVLEHLAYSDPLTGLPNRLALERDLAHLSERSSSGNVGVFFLDIDGFKLVNDAYGHATGDGLLRTVAERLSDLLRRGDAAYRLSGDEFVLVCSQLTSSEDARAVGERVCSSLERPILIDSQVVSVSVSVGIALSSDDGIEPEELLKRADAAMYEVKTGGKNGIRFYQGAREHELERRAELAQALAQVLAYGGEGLALFYQPIVDAATGRVEKVEALLRWEYKGGWVSPGEFIPIAEEVGLIRPLGTWVLHTACHQAQGWRGQNIDDIRVCVNISAHQFTQPDFVGVVTEALSRSGLPPHLLELELTESVLVQVFDRVRACLSRLRKQGVAVALDDFGTGYSSLSYLEELDFDTIKLDRSFVQKLSKTRESPHFPLAVVRAVVEIAAVLDVQVVTEGIETAEQQALLGSLGCTLMQGFLFARPMPAEQMQVHLREAVRIQGTSEPNSAARYLN